MLWLRTNITWDSSAGQADGEESVRMALDILASELIDRKGLNLGAAPLDKVLAEIGAADDLVETAAQLIEIVGRATYDGGLDEDDVETAEALRETLWENLEDLLNQPNVDGGEDD
jgi:hypothetical protein